MWVSARYCGEGAVYPKIILKPGMNVRRIHRIHTDHVYGKICALAFGLALVEWSDGKNTWEQLHKLEVAVLQTPA